ncbi:Uncharacterised protein [Vibrio cholerae]|nr:Uncharacterised protein [Vibrio cholerae]
MGAIKRKSPIREGIRNIHRLPVPAFAGGSKVCALSCIIYLYSCCVIQTHCSVEIRHTLA